MSAGFSHANAPSFRKSNLKFSTLDPVWSFLNLKIGLVTLQG